MTNWPAAIEAHPLYWAAVVFYGLYPILTSLLWVITAVSFHWRRERRPAAAPPAEETPFVSILVPAYCEEETIGAALEAALRIDYPCFEVLVINDGSADRTAERVRAYMSDPRVRLLDKQVNEGKAVALDDAIPCARGELVVTIDADAAPDRGLLRAMTPHFRDPRVGAVAGNPRVRGRHTLLARLQAVEFSSVIGLMRRAQRVLGRVMCVSGVVGMFRKSALLDAGLFTPGMATEDIDVTWKLQMKFYDVRYEARALVTMLVPQTIPVWWKQRRRWALGLGQVLRRHAGMWAHWKYRRMYPLYAESALSVVWALTFVVVTAYWALCYAAGHAPAGGSPIPNLWGMLLFTCCLFQLACGVWIDSNYDPEIRRDYWVSVLYPLVYWMLLATTTCLYTTRGLMGRLQLLRPTRWHIEHAYAKAAVALLAIVGAAGVLRAQPAAEVADAARAAARAGRIEEGLGLYRKALALEPRNLPVRLDYAVVLGWAERYDDSSREFRLVFGQQPEQPGWAWHERLRTELFAGHLPEALRIAERLIAQGDGSEVVLTRQALALRWMGRSREAEQVYRRIAARFPTSNAGPIGLVYALADQDELTRALREADAALAARPGDWQLQRARAQVLNWMGRHLEAQRAFTELSAAHGADREVLEGMALAARWGGDPGGAERHAALLAQRYPNQADAVRLHREIELENGVAVRSTFRFAGDSDGMTDQVAGLEFAVHAAPGQAFRFGVERRRFSQQGTYAWQRYEAGWSAAPARRVGLYATLADVEYLAPGRRAFVGDAGVSVTVKDGLRLSGGGGSMAMDAFQAVVNRVTARFYFGALAWRPTWRSSVEARYGEYRFSDGVRRQRVDASAFQRVYARPGLRLEAGARSNFLWHDRETGDFFSPSFLQSHVAVVRASGRRGRWLEYWAEAASGIQREPGVPAESPLSLSGSVLWRVHDRVHLLAEAGRSTSSVERVNPGRESYSRYVASVGLEIRF